MKDRKTFQIAISDRDSGLPFSKGLLASQVMLTGLAPYRAYQVAETVEERLRDQGCESLTSDELGELVVEVMTELTSDTYAKNFVRWRQVESLDVPLVILIGGATGVGKSTIATQLAARLGIVRVVATDAVREVMRSMLSPELMPTLHTSSFRADTALREPPTMPSDALVVGFREQTAAVAVGVDALIQRAAVEGTSIILEGAHIVPGFFDVLSFDDRILAVPFVVKVEDEARHISHFSAREGAVASRPAKRYADAFANIRRIQGYVQGQAESHGVPVIDNVSFDSTIAAAIDLILRMATERAGQDVATAKPLAQGQVAQGQDVATAKPLAQGQDVATAKPLVQGRSA